MGDRLGIPGVVGILFAVHKRATLFLLTETILHLELFDSVLLFLSVSARLYAAFSDYPTRLSETNQILCGGGREEKLEEAECGGLLPFCHGLARYCTTSGIGL